MANMKGIKYKNRWFSFFDLLGFQKLVQDKNLEYVIPIYEDILADLKSKADPKQKYGIDYSWFSDTFIIYATDDSIQSFALIEQASRLFYQKLILRRIPVRGAITVGELYTQKKRNIFLGQAVIDAYLYCESQNWLGLILTPHVYRRLENTDLDLRNRLYYREINNQNIIRKLDNKNVFAFTMNSLHIHDINKCIEAIVSMKHRVNDKYKIKYENTEIFIEQWGRLQPVQ
jgi:hypothetical protein